ncbi:ABC transporter substrate-binding protein [Chloroflexota bacterium]
MMKKVIWIFVSCLMALSLLVASCGPAAIEEEEEEDNVVVEEEEEEEEEQKEVVSKPTGPQYGGTITYRIAADPLNFDSGTQPRGGAMLGTVYQVFMSGDWLRGPAGSGVTNFAASTGSMDDLFGPQIAESWEMPEKGVWILNIRQDVHWQPVDSEAGRIMGGRKLTADDIIGGFNYLLNRDTESPAPNSWAVVGTAKEVAKTATIEKTGEWQVTIRTPVEVMTAFVYLIGHSGFYRIYPLDVIHKYGSLGDWHNAVGTGPYMLVDYVPGSSMSYKKNPIYWEKDPAGPGKGNQLPYADALKELIIPDMSTTYAALRTGKLDFGTGVTLTDAESLWSKTPDLEYVKFSTGFYGLGMAQEKEENPYHDVRVRHALMMATDFDAIVEDYWGGEAEKINWPANPSLVFYEPFDELSPEIQELYVYNPEKAKELLSEAGYPDGFKVNLIVQNIANRVDEMSIIKDMWAKVDVEVVLNPKEAGDYSRYVGAGVPYDEMLYRVFSGSYYPQHLYQGFTRGPGILNISHLNNPPGTNPYLEDLFWEEDEYLFVDMDRVHEAVKKVNRYMMEGAYQIPFPIPNRFNFWWPWLKNNYGQGTEFGFVRYSWLDRDLKKSMGY